jgi:diguanylate cyclase (GGDEF)-like protein
MTFDTYTLVVVTIVQATAMGITFLLASHAVGRRSTRSLTAWAVACFCLAGGWTLFTLSGTIPDFFSILVANAILVWAVGEFNQAFRAHDGEEPSRKPMVLVVALTTALTAGLVYLQDRPSMRTTVNTWVVACLFLLMAHRLLLKGQSGRSIARRIAAGVYLLLAALYLARGAVVVLSGSVMVSVVSNSPLQTAFFGVTAVALCVLSLCFLLMWSDRANAELKVLAVTDSLTGLLNRRATEEMSRREVARAARDHSPLAVVMLDADGFKAINDTLGHKSGDDALVAIAEALKANVRSHDIVGRIGGDEFAVVLPNTPQDAAERLAARLGDAVALAQVESAGHRVRLRVSHGIAMLDHDRPSFDEVCHRADSSLYDAKRRAGECQTPGGAASAQSIVSQAGNSG